MSKDLLEFRKRIFKHWIHDQISNWLDVYEAWDDLIEDGTINEEDWEFIRDKLRVANIEIEEK